MRDRGDLEEQRWQPAASGPFHGNDPLAELARIVGQGGAAPPASNDPSPQPAGLSAGQQDWINEIERAFAQVVPPAAPARPDETGAREVPAWLRSPAVPQLPVAEGQKDPRLEPDAFTQDFTRELDAASAARETGYYAQDPYQLAAGGAEAAGAALPAGMPLRAQPEEAYRPDADAYDQQPHARPAPSPGGYGAQDAPVYGYETPDYGDGYQSAEGLDDEYAYQARRPGRRRLLGAAALAAGLLVLVAGGYVMLRGGGGETVSGEPPVVTADSQPVKVEPEAPGGLEVPNTNRAIYEHTNQAPSGEGAVVVDDREQPVDINQMIAQQNTAEQTAEHSAGTTTAGAAGVVLPEAPQPTSPAIAALGEPRRVRTVSVRPDGSILPSEAPATPAAPSAQAPTIEQLATATPAPSVAEPSPTTPADAEAVVPTVGPVPRPASVNRPATRAPLQLGPMAISPGASNTQVAAAPAPAAQPAASAAPGSFTVQLAAPGSEGEARNLFASLQRRYSDLAGYSPTIMRADSGGRTIYRLRVGSFPSRDAATALCVRIQASGGQCFVARN